MKSFKVIKITESDARNNDLNKYNFDVWNKKISRLVDNYEDVEFYFNEEANEMFAEYTITEGIRLFSELTYHSTLTNGGFYRLDRFPITKDGKDAMDALDLINDGREDEGRAIIAELHNRKHFDISYGYFFEENGDKVLFGTSKEARKDMARRSDKYNCVFTKG